MSKHFDPSRMHEFHGELKALDHLNAALEALPGGQPAHHVREAIGGLHHFTRVPEAVAELREHVASTQGALSAPAKKASKAKK